MYFEYPYANPESLEGDEYFIATYLVSGVEKETVLKRVGNFAIGQTIGTWLPLPGITKQMVSDYQARVISLIDLSGKHNLPSFYALQVAFPLRNFGGSFAMLLTGLLGNDVSTSLQVKLIDLSLSSRALSHYSGPKQSVAGIRKLIGVEDRPLILNMLKPSIGLSPSEASILFYEVGMGGVDMVKDDEVLSSVPASKVVDRVKAFNNVSKRITTESGRTVLYIPNITDHPQRMHDNIKAVIDAGGKAAMINYVVAGLDALAELSECYGSELALLGHYAGFGMMNSASGGVAPSVMLGLLPRIAGADMVMTMYPGPHYNDGYLDYLKTIQKQKLELGKIKPVFSTVGGGLTPLNIGEVIHEVGQDVVLGVGGAIQGHPLGARAGAKAVTCAVDCAMHNKDLLEISKDCKELQIAIEIWGHH